MIVVPCATLNVSLAAQRLDVNFWGNCWFATVPVSGSIFWSVLVRSYAP
jgi:hypothetical protein